MVTTQYFSGRCLERPPEAFFDNFIRVLGFSHSCSSPPHKLRIFIPYKGLWPRVKVHYVMISIYIRNANNGDLSLWYNQNYISINVYKWEQILILTIKVYMGVSNHFLKNILTARHFQTLVQAIILKSTVIYSQLRFSKPLVIGDAALRSTVCALFLWLGGALLVGYQEVKVKMHVKLLC